MLKIMLRWGIGNSELGIWSSEFGIGSWENL